MPRRDPEAVRTLLARHHPDPRLRGILEQARVIAVPWRDCVAAAEELGRRLETRALSPEELVRQLGEERAEPLPELPIWVGLADSDEISSSGTEILGFLCSEEGTWLFASKDLPLAGSRGAGAR